MEILQNMDWGHVGRCIRRRTVVPTTINELSATLQEEWQNILQNDIHQLVTGMGRYVGDS